MENDIKNITSVSPYLEGQLLIATPLLAESCFEKSVIYICSHNEQGAMGMLINQAMDGLTCTDLLNQLDIRAPLLGRGTPIHFGGPVEPGKGFILHTGDYHSSGTHMVGRNIALTSTVNILKDIARGKGPTKSIIALGYAGWSAGQLEAEIASNSWIIAPASEELIFGQDNASKWMKSAESLGVNLHKYSPVVGHA